MAEIVLYEPEIPQNTGSVARLCAATKTVLNLIEPLGFSLSDKYLKRAGLDYWPHVVVRVWPDYPSFLATVPGRRLVYMTAGNRGQQSVPYHQFPFEPDDLLVFGTESRGLPDALLDGALHVARIPIWGKVRSLNLANAASIILYEALRRVGELEGK